jgi:hypothetical protein
VPLGLVGEVEALGRLGLLRHDVRQVPPQGQRRRLMAYCGGSTGSGTVARVPHASHGPEGFKARNHRHPSGDLRECLDCRAAGRGAEDTQVTP